MKFYITLFILLFSAITVASPLNLNAVSKKILHGDPRNNDIKTQLMDEKGTLQFCVEGIGEFSSQNDVFRVFMQTAAALKEQRFSQVVLCYQNDNKYLLSGEDFQTIGQEYGVQNVAYTVRTFPEKLRLANGEKPFLTHRGGMLYVMNRQMADFNIMNRQWYLSDILQKRKAIEDSKRPKTFAKDEDVF